MIDNILVTIPAYNSEKTISSVLESLGNQTVLVINDGSTDSTANIVSEMGIPIITHESNLGVGQAMKTGIQFAIDNGFTHIICMDSDGQHPTDYVNRFADMLTSYDFVVGNRFNCPNKVPHQKLSSNFLGCLLTYNIFKMCVKDISCGFRAFKVLNEYLTLDSDGYGFIFEHIFHAITNRMKIGYVNIPAIYNIKDLLCTRRSELLAFINAILKVNKIEYNKLFEKIKSLYDAIIRSSNFSIFIGAQSFYGIFIPQYQSYIVQTDFQKAVTFYEAMSHKQNP